jgi:hypothetical protein
MELTQEERERVKASIGEMLTGEPITDAELENLANVAPAAFYVIESRELGITGRRLKDTVVEFGIGEFLQHRSHKEVGQFKCVPLITRKGGGTI